MISKSKYNDYKLEEILDKEWGIRSTWGAILSRVIRDSLTDSGNTLSKKPEGGKRACHEVK